MPCSDLNTHTSARVQRATRLNGLEQSRLQQRLQLLDKDRLRQARLTNQDIRLTSAALDYVLNSSGHSPEGQDPGSPPVDDLSRQQLQYFLYGERVVSRRIHRMLRPLSATLDPPPERPPSGPPPTPPSASDVEVGSVATLPQNPPQRSHSSPARGRTWVRLDSQAEGRWTKPTTKDGDEQDSPLRSASASSASSSSYAFFNRGMLIFAGKSRLAPHQVWEDDVHDVTRKLLRAQRRQQQLENSRWTRLYRSQDDRRRSRNKLLSYISFPGPHVPVSPLLHLKDVPKGSSGPKKQSKLGSAKASVRTL